MTRIVFIGAGGIARQHAAGLVKRDDVEIAGAYDVAPERAASFASQFGGAAYGDLGEMLDAARPDAAWVCLPPFAHGEAERALLSRRIPFCVEKPISNSMDTSRRILDEIERTNALVSVCYMSRYRRSINRAKELLADDPAVLLHGGWIGGTPGVYWWRRKELSGGQIVEQTTHTFDLARYLAGEPVTVCGRAARGFVRDMPDYDVEDASSVAIQFAGGAVGNLMSCCANRSGGGGVHLTIVARNHVSVLTGWNHDAIIHKSRLEQEHITGEPNIFEIEDAAFLQAVASGDRSPIRCDYADGLKTLAFCIAANRAVETGEAVEVASL
ncbi:MAG: Gfo/Idh/MocA family oxidoreductase [Chloroflexi bacterium]|nr:Gfo/Idh/MocA family oxidoreductase [Chloroflexota bacterium]